MSIVITAGITFTHLDVTQTARIGSTYIPPLATLTDGGWPAAPTGDASSTTSYHNPNPTTPAFLSSYDWINSYLIIHTMTPASYRYAYLGWFIVTLVVIFCALLHLTGGRGGALGATWFKWALRRRTWRKQSTLRAIQKSPKTHRQPLVLPSNAQILSLVLIFLISAILCTIGPDYIAPGTHVWDLTHNLTRRHLPEDVMYDLTEDGSLLPRDGPPIASTATTRPPEFTIQKSWWTAGSRSGIMAFSLFPLVVLFALKAPPFALFAIPFTIQIHFDKLARLHRWTGRLIWLITAVHVGTWSVQLWNDRRHGHDGRAWNYVWMYHKFIYGMIGFVAMTLLTLLSIKPIRTRFYELFYISHVILVPITLVFSALHFPPIWWWAWAPLFLWIVERGYRFIRFSWRNAIFLGTPRGPSPYGLSEEDAIDGGYASASYASGVSGPARENLTMRKGHAATTGEAWEMGVRSSKKSSDGHASLRLGGDATTASGAGHSPVGERVRSGESFHPFQWDHKGSTGGGSEDADETIAGDWSANSRGSDSQEPPSYPKSRERYTPVPNTAHHSSNNHGGLPQSRQHRHATHLNATNPSLYHLSFPTVHPLPGILSNNTLPARFPPPGFAKCLLLPGQTIRLSLITARRFSWAPGQHVLLTLPEISRFTSHPFTVASVSDSAIAGPQGRELILIIRVKKGFTGDLLKKMIKRGGGKTDNETSRKSQKQDIEKGRKVQHVRDDSHESFGNDVYDTSTPIMPRSAKKSGVVFRAYVDGPFGSSVRAHWGMHSSVLIICGGSGVSFGTSILEYLCLCLCGRDGRSLGGKSGGVGKDGFVTRRVRFVWLIREFAHIQWCAPILRRCLDMIPNQNVLQVDVFVTHFVDSSHKHGASVNDMAKHPYLLNSLADSGAMNSSADSGLVPPAPQFAKESKRMERRLSSSSVSSLDSNASRGSDFDLDYHGEGRSSVHHQAPSTGADLSKDGHHVLDLTNFDGDDDTRIPGESHMSIRVRKEGRIRRAQSRRQASAAQARAELNRKTTMYSNAYSTAEDFDPSNQEVQHAPTSPHTLPRAMSPPITQPAHKTPARPKHWDLSDPTPEPRGVSLYDPPVVSTQEPKPSRWGDSTTPSARAINPRTDDCASSPLAVTSPTPQSRYPSRPAYPDNRLSTYTMDSFQDGRPSPAPSTLYVENAGFDTRTIGGSESMRHLMASGPRTSWYQNKEEDLAAFEYDDEELEDMNVVSEVARPGKPRLDKIVMDEVERSKGAVAVACCGPASLNALVRKAVAARLDPARIRRGDLRGQITLISEDFEW